jgi:hypothetical protein
VAVFLVKMPWLYAVSAWFNGAAYWYPQFTPAVASTNVGVGQTASPKNERELIAILRSDAPKAEKALACKNLSVYGSSESTAELAKLLEDLGSTEYTRS